MIVGALTAVLINQGAPAQAEEEQMAPPPTDTPAEASPAKTVKSNSSAVKGEKRKTKIDFEDELVEGELKKPELFYLLQKKQFNFKRLIKLREDFLPEMRRDADEVRRSRSK
jgi:hypothetical protein